MQSADLHDSNENLIHCISEEIIVQSVDIYDSQDNLNSPHIQEHTILETLTHMQTNTGMYHRYFWKILLTYYSVVQIIYFETVQYEPYW